MVESDPAPAAHVAKMRLRLFNGHTGQENLSVALNMASNSAL